MRLNLDESENTRARLSFAGYGAIALALGSFFHTAHAGDAVGWRSDGKGAFKALGAPTRWSRDEGVAWQTQLPATSISSPIVAGERAFVMAEPNRLLCFRLSDGELLWDRAHEYEDIFGPEKATEIKEKHAQAQKLREDIAELEKQLAPKQEADADSAEVKSLRDRIGELQKRYEELTDIPPPQVDSTGNTASTPVCDLENVYAVLGNGIVSSHRQGGERNWIRFIGKPMAGHSASPLVVGNLLIVHLKQLVALDLASGEVAWQTDTPPRNGTPVTLTVGEQAVIVTPAGAVVSAEDGRVLAKDLFDLAYCSPIAHEGVVFAAERGRLVAIKLSPSDEAGAIETEKLWETRAAEDDRLASPVVHEGLLFSATGSGILDVVDIASGKIIARKRLKLGEGRVDSSLSLANGLLYIQSTGGTTVVLEPTSDCAEVARNEAEGSSSSPFFVDERILFRTPTHMICVGGE
jgi:outer membrane protein assembly factor BamB